MELWWFEVKPVINCVAFPYIMTTILSWPAQAGFAPRAANVQLNLYFMIYYCCSCFQCYSSSLMVGSWIYHITYLIRVFSIWKCNSLLGTTLSCEMHNTVQNDGNAAANYFYTQWNTHSWRIALIPSHFYLRQTSDVFRDVIYTESLNITNGFTFCLQRMTVTP